MLAPALVIDANILVSALLKDSTTRKLLLSEKTPKLFAPAFILEELQKHSDEFAKKIGTTKKIMEEKTSLLFEASEITVYEKSEYAEFLSRAQK